MTEYTITREDAKRDLRALRGALSGRAVGVSSSCIPALQELADAIEEQVKPAIEEPTEWGSVVRASFPNSDGDRILLAFVPNPQESDPDKPQGYPWYSERDDWCAWDDLSDVEVLRIGVGEAPSKRLLDFLTELHGLIAWGSIPAQLLHDLVSAFEIDTASADEWARLDAANADTDAYAKGAADTAAKVMRWLRQLRAEALTFERQNAYDKAIKLVEELAP